MGRICGSDSVSGGGVVDVDAGAGGGIGVDLGVVRDPRRCQRTLLIVSMGWRFGRLCLCALLEVSSDWGLAGAGSGVAAGSEC